jgi:hypothetical protein
MTGMGEALAREALGLVGVPFRMHGRTEVGVDCVGLVALAAWRAGHRGAAPDRYSLRGGRVAQFEAWLAAAGLRRVERMQSGDVVLVQAGVRQFHLMVFAGAGFVHAHAGLRRVVAMPGESPWPVNRYLASGVIMATLVLTAVGTALGGPIGGAIGAVLGQAVDQNLLFKPKGREGPRLERLDVQTSTYGSQVPKIFGRMRVAGTVIWATDLKETKKTSGGGKGRPSSTTYSYSASFAVAISSRRVLRVERIWADGNLLRGAAGDFKSEVGAFRLLAGDEDQDADQLVASAEGVALTPAYRGTAYALFEDLQLADFGNRIPSLTFEVVADEEPVLIADIAEELSEGVLKGAGEENVAGYAASGSGISDAIEPLVRVFDLRLRPGLDGLVLDGAVEAEGEIAQGALAGRVNGRVVTPVSTAKQAAVLIPRSLSVRYYDAERDYQAGLQRGSRPGAGRMQSQIDLPAVLPAAQAKQLAAAKIAALWKGRSTIELLCGWSQLERVPGSVVSVAGMPGLWAIEQLQWEAMAVRLSLRQVGMAPAISAEASAGALVREADLPHGPTSLILADLPGLGDVPATVPAVVVAAAGVSAGWRRASLFVEEGDEVVGVGQTGAPATMGHCVTILGDGSGLLFDDAATLDVELLADDMLLAGVSDDALLRGGNLCLVGGELLQFGRAVQTGPRQYRLSRLLRGRRGTEWAIAGHVGDESFLLIEADALVAVPDAYVRAGSLLTMLALGVGDVEPAEVALTVSGEALKPPSPVHLTIEVDGVGDRTIGWIRRSRSGWAWADYVDAPLGEEAELYRLRVMAGEIVLRSVEVAVPEFAYSAAMAAADEAAGGSTLTLEIVQIGARGVSRPLVGVIEV